MPPALLVNAVFNSTVRERARQELAQLLDDRRPLPTSAHFRRASDISDPIPRPVLRAAGLL